MISRSSRTKDFVELARGKSVLDIGCVGFLGKAVLHRKLFEVAKRIVGLDIKVKGIELLRKEGYDIRLISVDGAPFDLGEKFDLIVAGATIEYLYDLRIFMDNVRRHLAPDGLFVGTTPNPQAFEFFLECLFFKKALRHIKFQTHWQNERTLKCLFETSGLRLDSIKHLHKFAKSWVGKIYDILFFWMPPWFSREIMFTARLDDKV